MFELSKGQILLPCIGLELVHNGRDAAPARPRGRALRWLQRRGEHRQQREPRSAQCAAAEERRGERECGLRLNAGRPSGE